MAGGSPSPCLLPSSRENVEEECREGKTTCCHHSLWPSSVPHTDCLEKGRRSSGSARGSGSSRQGREEMGRESGGGTTEHGWEGRRYQKGRVSYLLQGLKSPQMLFLQHCLKGEGVTPVPLCSLWIRPCQTPPTRVSQQDSDLDHPL